MGIILAILIFGFIVFFHELGHFLLAKANGIEVTEFALGMGPILFSKERKGTVYALKLLPIGGSCTMGEDEEATDSPSNFNNKSVPARISVIVAGAVFNFILAFILSVILTGMVGYDEPVLSEVQENSVAAEAGLKAGDKILKFNNKRIYLFRELSFYTQLNRDQEITLTYVRDGERHTTESFTPKYSEETKSYRVGVASSGYQKANLLKAVQYGYYEVRLMINSTFESLKMLLTGQVGINDLSGPVGIADMVDSTYKESVDYGAKVVISQLLSMAILISANLGVMNLLPLPALDGGRLIFLIIEGIRRKRIPPEKEGMVHMVGIMLLMLLMVVVMFNDIRKVFF